MIPELFRHEPGHGGFPAGVVAGPQELGHPEAALEKTVEPGAAEVARSPVALPDLPHDGGLAAGHALQAEEHPEEVEHRFLAGEGPDPGVEYLLRHGAARGQSEVDFRPVAGGHGDRLEDPPFLPEGREEGPGVFRLVPLSGGDGRVVQGEAEEALHESAPRFPARSAR
ncbi:hypothetical protein SDC9_73926 [bioreactor metagenome]|uniref:Uncharacterized protein n=1 Tax=bioreactor metagenome TaxID=1076179 RepID=A0A644YFQ7_9ZZZZ